MKYVQLLNQATAFSEMQLAIRQKHQTRLDNLHRMSQEAVESIRQRADEEIKDMNALFTKLMNEESEAIAEIDSSLATEEEE